MCLCIRWWSSARTIAHLTAGYTSPHKARLSSHQSFLSQRNEHGQGVSSVSPKRHNPRNTGLERYVFFPYARTTAYRVQIV